MSQPGSKFHAANVELKLIWDEHSGVSHHPISYKTLMRCVTLKETCFHNVGFIMAGQPTPPNVPPQK